MQTSYPVFESGQVLTSRHLNDLVAYLDDQDRLTRGKLIGIGIVCGLEVDFRAQEEVIEISGGVAVTSQGHLIVSPPARLDRYRDYTLPVPHLEEAAAEQIDEARYTFFYEDNQQIPLWELLPTDYVPAPGEPAPQPIDQPFLEEKVVLLFLECKLESLKNCDINDCSDKGAELEFTLRKLLISVEHAQALLQKEKEIAQRPVDQSNHPKFALKELQIEKINPHAHDVTSFIEFYQRIEAIAGKLFFDVWQRMQNGYDAYDYLLADMYPASQFPNGPFGPEYVQMALRNLIQNVGGNVLLVQYAYDWLRDLVQAYNEFLRAAMRIDAECCPHPDRFPKHVLLGLVAPRPTAGIPEELDQGELLFNNTGLGAASLPSAFRHHFVPSPLFDQQRERLAEVRSLHYRLYQLTLRFRLHDLPQQAIRITPSKEGDYPLSEKAIPFYYKFALGDDLHRNWSFAKITANRWEQVFSYWLPPFPPVSGQIDHPLLDRRDDHNFYRVEGIVGQPLGATMAELIKQKRELGLSFGIEPVYIGLNVEGDSESTKLDEDAVASAMLALVKILACRMRDLDVIFLILMAVLFWYLFVILWLLSRLNPRRLAGIGAEPRPKADERAPKAASKYEFLQPSLRPKEYARAMHVLESIRPRKYKKGFVTAQVTSAEDPFVSIGQLYNTIREVPAATSLFDRTVEVAKQLDPKRPEAVAQKIYPAVALMDKAEELVEVVSAPSIAEFDAQQFQAKYDGFVKAFEAFQARADVDPTKADAQVAETNQSIMAASNAVVATNPIVEFLIWQLQLRTYNIFDELRLSGYSKRHPGMEHKSGVPVGGTLILLYTHVDFLSQTLNRRRDVIKRSFDSLRSRLDASTAAAIDQPTDFAIVPPNPDEPLDNFVVLADFCVPYLCCDTDCSDVGLADLAREPGRPNTPDEPTSTGTPVRVSGAVVGEPPRPNTTMRPLPSAKMTVTNVETGQDIAVGMRRGRFSFSALPGKYRIEAAAGARFEPLTKVMTIAGRALSDVSLVLKRRG